ncbi:MAG TPA: hypothetical protein VEU72_05850 [Nitrosopumilaceae archaeon]|nr:hypothetical protein [Nitrosopumilaceae archaeon]
MGKNKDEGFDKKHNDERRPKKFKNKIIAIAIIASIVAILAVAIPKLDNTRAGNSVLIDGIECDTTEYVTFHVHAHLDIFVDGHPLTVPAFIGIENNNSCLYWLHTHTPDGVIHIESPQERGFTLGQFFDIWQSTSIGMPPTDRSPIIYVNGQAVTTSLKDTSLHAHDEIALVYGNPPTNIPAFYQFPEGE